MGRNHCGACKKISCFSRIACAVDGDMTENANVPERVRSFFPNFSIKCSDKGTVKELLFNSSLEEMAGKDIRYMEKKVTPEKRMELARYIREENLGNRLKLRQRENILYGKETRMPLYEKGFLSETEGFAGCSMPEAEKTIPSTGGFKYRMVLAVLLFVGFLLCDTRDSKIFTYSTNDVYEMIRSDSLHLSEGGENAVMEELAEIFD